MLSKLLAKKKDLDSSGGPKIQIQSFGNESTEMMVDEDGQTEKEEEFDWEVDQTIPSVMTCSSFFII
jgi:hypothetical protein